MEKEMATHSNILAWRIPGTEQPGGLPPLGSNRVGHDWSDAAAYGINMQQIRKKLGFKWNLYFYSNIHIKVRVPLLNVETLIKCLNS